MRGGAWPPRNLSFESRALDARYLSILMQIGAGGLPTETRDERPSQLSHARILAEHSPAHFASRAGFA
jgi:hypothetical protein